MIRELVVALGGIALGAATLLVLPGQVPGGSLASIGDMTSPAFFPVLAALLVLGAGAALLPAALRARPAAGQDEPRRPARAAVLAAMLVGGAALVPLLGGLPVIFLLMCGTALLAGARRPLPVLAVAGAGVLAIHLLFERMLKVLLPGGSLFGA